MIHADIEKNRHVSSYSSSEMFRRVVWGGGAILFRFSFRPMFGWRRFLLRLHGARIGRKVNVYPTARIEQPWNLTVGDWSSIGEYARIYDLGKVTLGERVTISQYAHLCAGTHDYCDPGLPLVRAPISIGDDAWICADAFIVPGVQVGKGTVVGARAVVIKDVGAWEIVAGNPVFFIKNRVMGKPS